LNLFSKIPTMFAIRTRFGAGLVVICVLAAATGLSAQQAAAQSSDGSSAPIFAPGEPVNLEMGGVQAQAICVDAGEEGAQPILECTIQANEPINVTNAKVADPASGDTWTADFLPFERAEDRTAYLFLIDRSDPRRRATIAAIVRELGEVLENLGPGQQVAVASFAEELTFETENFTSDREVLLEALAGIEADGQATELYRNTLTAVSALAETVDAPARVLVLISDGLAEDNEQLFSPGRVIEAANNTGVRIVSLGFIERPSQTPNLQSMRVLSADTDGIFAQAALPDRVLPDQIKQTLMSQFSGGGRLVASAPSLDLPRALNIRLELDDGQVAQFVTSMQASDGEVDDPAQDSQPTQVRVAPQEEQPPLTAIEPTLLYQITSLHPAILIATGLVVLFVLAGLIGLMRRSTKPVPQTIVSPSPQTPDASPPKAPAAETIKPAVPTPSRSTAAPIAFLDFESPQELGAVPVREKQITIGRYKDDTIRINDETVSRQHALLSRNPVGRFEILNRQSSRKTPNPIFVNGQEVEKSELVNGDRVKLGTGDVIFVFRIAEAL
jgi:pSer/pThr/pTyr-binding forkhead associated (FHA) protein